MHTSFKGRRNTDLDLPFSRIKNCKSLVNNIQLCIEVGNPLTAGCETGLRKHQLQYIPVRYLYKYASSTELQIKTILMSWEFTVFGIDFFPSQNKFIVKEDSDLFDSHLEPGTNSEVI